MSTRPRQALSVVHKAALTCVAALTLVVAASSGIAQTDHSTAVRVLRESRDFRARVRAALALGNSADRRVTPHLVRALRDSSPAVRAAAATALGRLGDSSALGALRRCSDDSSRVVRDEARRAIRRIQSAGPTAPSAPPRRLTRTQTGVLPAISVVPRAREIYWPRVRYVVVLGPMENRSSFRHERLTQLLVNEVTRSLIVLRGVATLHEGEISSAAEREIRRRRLPRLRLEGSVNSVERRARRRQLSVRCEVSLMLMDQGRNLRSVLNGAATGTGPRRGQRDQQERRLAEQALAGAVRSAMSGAARAIASAGR